MTLIQDIHVVDVYLRAQNPMLAEVELLMEVLDRNRKERETAPIEEVLAWAIRNGFRTQAQRLVTLLHEEVISGFSDNDYNDFDGGIAIQGEWSELERLPESWEDADFFDTADPEFPENKKRWNEQLKPRLEPQVFSAFDRAFSRMNAERNPMYDSFLDFTGLAFNHGAQYQAENLGLVAPQPQPSGQQQPGQPPTKGPTPGGPFALPNPRAVDWMRMYGADTITGINETTRADMKALLSSAMNMGWSYSNIRRAINFTFDGYNTPQPQKHIKDRAELIAVTELAYAYEQGNLAPVEHLQKLGIVMEKSWISATDNRVDPMCAANVSQGYIPVDKVFASSHAIPPAHPACRCSTLYRRMKPDKNGCAVGQVALVESGGVIALMLQEADPNQVGCKLPPGVVLAKEGTKKNAAQKLFLSGKTVKEIAADMGISYQQAYQYCQGLPKGTVVPAQSVPAIKFGPFIEDPKDAALAAQQTQGTPQVAPPPGLVQNVAKHTSVPGKMSVDDLKAYSDSLEISHNNTIAESLWDFLLAQFNNVAELNDFHTWSINLTGEGVDDFTQLKSLENQFLSWKASTKPKVPVKGKVPMTVDEAKQLQPGDSWEYTTNPVGAKVPVPQTYIISKVTPEGIIAHLPTTPIANYGPLGGIKFTWAEIVRSGQLPGIMQTLSDLGVPSTSMARSWLQGANEAIAKPQTPAEIIAFNDWLKAQGMMTLEKWGDAVAVQDTLKATYADYLAATQVAPAATPPPLVAGTVVNYDGDVWVIKKVNVKKNQIDLTSTQGYGLMSMSIDTFSKANPTLAAPGTETQQYAGLGPKAGKLSKVVDFTDPGPVRDILSANLTDAGFDDFLYWVTNNPVANTTGLTQEEILKVMSPETVKALLVEYHQGTILQTDPTTIKAMLKKKTFVNDATIPDVPLLPGVVFGQTQVPVAPATLPPQTAIPQQSQTQAPATTPTPTTIAPNIPPPPVWSADEIDTLGNAGLTSNARELLYWTLLGQQPAGNKLQTKDQFIKACVDVWSKDQNTTAMMVLNSLSHADFDDIAQNMFAEYQNLIHGGTVSSLVSPSGPVKTITKEQWMIDHGMKAKVVHDIEDTLVFHKYFPTNQELVRFLDWVTDELNIGYSIDYYNVEDVLHRFEDWTKQGKPGYDSTVDPEATGPKPLNTMPPTKLTMEDYAHAKQLSTADVQDITSTLKSVAKSNYGLDFTDLVYQTFLDDVLAGKVNYKAVSAHQLIMEMSDDSAVATVVFEAWLPDPGTLPVNTPPPSVSPVLQTQVTPPTAAPSLTPGEKHAIENEVVNLIASGAFNVVNVTATVANFNDFFTWAENAYGDLSLLDVDTVASKYETWWNSVNSPAGPPPAQGFVLSLDQFQKDLVSKSTFPVQEPITDFLTGYPVAQAKKAIELLTKTPIADLVKGVQGNHGDPAPAYWVGYQTEWEELTKAIALSSADPVDVLNSVIAAYNVQANYWAAQAAAAATAATQVQTQVAPTPVASPAQDFTIADVTDWLFINAPASFAEAFGDFIDRMEKAGIKYVDDQKGLIKMLAYDITGTDIVTGMKDAKLVPPGWTEKSWKPLVQAVKGTLDFGAYTSVEEAAAEFISYLKQAIVPAPGTLAPVTTNAQDMGLFVAANKTAGLSVTKLQNLKDALKADSGIDATDAELQAFALWQIQNAGDFTEPMDLMVASNWPTWEGEGKPGVGPIMAAMAAAPPPTPVVTKSMAAYVSTLVGTGQVADIVQNIQNVLNTTPGVDAQELWEKLAVMPPDVAKVAFSINAGPANKPPSMSLLEYNVVLAGVITAGAFPGVAGTPGFTNWSGFSQTLTAAIKIQKKDKSLPTTTAGQTQISTVGTLQVKTATGPSIIDWAHTATANFIKFQSQPDGFPTIKNSDPLDAFLQDTLVLPTYTGGVKSVHMTATLKGKMGGKTLYADLSNAQKTLLLDVFMKRVDDALGNVSDEKYKYLDTVFNIEASDKTAAAPLAAPAAPTVIDTVAIVQKDIEANSTPVNAKAFLTLKAGITDKVLLEQVMDALANSGLSGYDLSQAVNNHQVPAKWKLGQSEWTVVAQALLTAAYPNTTVTEGIAAGFRLSIKEGLKIAEQAKAVAAAQAASAPATIQPKSIVTYWPTQATYAKYKSITQQLEAMPNGVDIVKRLAEMDSQIFEDAMAPGSTVVPSTFTKAAWDQLKTFLLGPVSPLTVSAGGAANFVALLDFQISLGMASKAAKADNYALNAPGAVQRPVFTVFGPKPIANVSVSTGKPAETAWTPVTPAQVNREGRKSQQDILLADWARPGVTPSDVYGGSHEESAFKAQLASNLGALVGIRMTDDQIAASPWAIASLGFADAAAFKAALADPARKQQILSRLSSMVVKTWASTSFDANPLSIAFQRAAYEEFQMPAEVAARIKGTVDYDALWNGTTKYNGTNLGFTDADRAILRVMARAMYDMTQAEFQRLGIKSLKLARGATYTGGRGQPSRSDVRNKHNGTMTVTMSQNPLASWSVAENIASQFAGGSSNAAIYYADVPVERILCFPRTGSGCLHEWEVLVMAGGDQKATVVLA